MYTKKFLFVFHVFINNTYTMYLGIKNFMFDEYKIFIELIR